MLASKVLVQRGLASAASAASSGAALLPAAETKVSRLPSGLSVASVELNGAVSSLVVAYRAGARYQQPDEQGLVHHLRNNFGRDSQNYLGVKLLWQLGSVGGNLTATHGKDLIAVQTNVIRDNSAIAVSILGELAKPALKPWDVEDAAHTVPADVHAQTGYDVVVDLIHQAAYRNGSLANPVTAALHDKVSYKQLELYSKARLVSGEAVLLGVNVDHADLLGYAQAQSAIGEGRGAAPPASPYVGGDVHLAGPSAAAHVIIAGPGAALNNVKEVAVQKVLATLIGHESEVKFGGAAGAGVVGAAVQKATNQRPVGVSAVDLAHQDAGLAGVYLAVEGQYAEPAVRAAFAGLQQLAQGADAGALAVAKSQARVAALLQLDQPQNLALDQAADILANTTATSPLDLAQLIDQVTAEDVKKAAQKITAKPSLAAFGRVNQVPYVDQL